MCARQDESEVPDEKWWLNWEIIKDYQKKSGEKFSRILNPLLDGLTNNKRKYFINCWKYFVTGKNIVNPGANLTKLLHL